MNKLNVAIVAVCALVSFCAQESFSALLDQHFGVNLGLQADGNAAGGYRFDHSTFTPTSNVATTDYSVNDWWNGNHTYSTSGPGDILSGGEIYDIEAIYADDDANNVYLAIVTSFPSPYGHYDSNAGAFLVNGDIAIDRGLNTELNGFSYDYGVNINYEVQPTGSGNATLPNPAPPIVFPSFHSMYRTNNSDWYLGSPNNDIQAGNELTNIDPNNVNFAGTLAGSVFVDYRLLEFGGLQENGEDTYIIEAVIPRIFLGGLNVGELLTFSWSMGCRNDAGVLDLTIDIDTPYNPPVAIPEPMSVITLLAGCLGMAGKYFSKKK